MFLFVHDCLITHLSWKILLRPKRSNLKWLWFFISYLIFSYENSATYEYFWFFHTQSIKEIRAISYLAFLALYEFSKINELPNNHVQTKTHHTKVFLGLISYQLKIHKIDHSDFGGSCWICHLELSFWSTLEIPLPQVIFFSETVCPNFYGWHRRGRNK